MIKAHVFQKLDSCCPTFWCSEFWPIRHLFVIEFLLMVKGGWQITDENSVTLYTLQLWKSGNDWFSKMPSVHWACFTPVVTNSTFKSNARARLREFISFFPPVSPPQAFAIPGQYTFAHQDVSICFWVSVICPVDVLTPSKLPQQPLFTLLCNNETPTFWH